MIINLCKKEMVPVYLSGNGNVSIFHKDNYFIPTVKPKNDNYSSI